MKTINFSIPPSSIPFLRNLLTFIFDRVVCSMKATGLSQELSEGNILGNKTLTVLLKLLSVQKDIYFRYPT